MPHSGSSPSARSPCPIRLSCADCEKYRYASIFFLAAEIYIEDWMSLVAVCAGICEIGVVTASFRVS